MSDNRPSIRFKPLVWRRVVNAYVSRIFGITYWIELVPGGCKWGTYHAEVGAGLKISDLTSARDEEAAKAACNEHFAALLMAQIEPEEVDDAS